jgi:hypothetical protein
MKKTMIQLAIAGAVLGCVTSVFAGPITSPLQAGDCLHEVDGGIHAKAHGSVVLKATRVGYDVTYQLSSAAPRYSYCAVISGQPVGYLTTDKKGGGSLTVSVNSNPTTWGNWIGLRETDGQLSTCTNPLPPGVPQALLAAANPFNPPPPATL